MLKREEDAGLERIPTQLGRPRSEKQVADAHAWRRSGAAAVHENAAGLWNAACRCPGKALRWAVAQDIPLGNTTGQLPHLHQCQRKRSEPLVALRVHGCPQRDQPRDGVALPRVRGKVQGCRGG